MLRLLLAQASSASRASCLAHALACSSCSSSSWSSSASPAASSSGRNLHQPFSASTSASSSATHQQQHSLAEEEANFVGAYTPVTRGLWQERLRRAREGVAAGGSAAAAAAASSVARRPPQRTVISYPFSSDKFLLEMYRNPWGFLRMGRLLEDLDSLAGSIAFEHCHTPGLPPPLLVTVNVDAIEYDHPVTLDKDMVAQGQVVFTGGSSLDIRMEVLQEPFAPQPSLVALFSFVLLDPATRRPSKVPQLAPVTPQEADWAAERAAVAAERKAARAAASAAGGQPALPAAKQARLQELLDAARLAVDMPALAAPGDVPARATVLQNAFVCQPQQRNMNGRIFGGFLMRRAFELAFSTTYLFAGSRPAFVRVDDITFRNPVDIGSLLRFTSYVVDVTYEDQQQTQQQQDQQQQHHALVAVEVRAVVSKPEEKQTTHTNTFRYVFCIALPRGERLRRVLPTTAADVERLTRYLADS